MKNILVVVFPLIVLLSACKGQRNLNEGKCAWSKPVTSISSAGANGLRQISVESSCEQLTCITPTIIEVNGRRFAVEVDSLDHGLRLFTLIPLEEFQEGAVGNQSTSDWGQQILEEKVVQVRFLNENDWSCSFDSIALSDSGSLNY